MFSTEEMEGISERYQLLIPSSSDSIRLRSGIDSPDFPVDKVKDDQ